MGLLIPLLPAYTTWVIGLSLFGLAAAAIIVVTILNPTLFAEGSFV